MLAHRGDHTAGETQGALQVDPPGVLPVLIGSLQSPAESGLARIIHQHIDATIVGEGGVDDPLDRRSIRDVSGRRDNLDIVAAKVLGGLCQGVFAARTDG